MVMKTKQAEAELVQIITWEGFNFLKSEQSFTNSVQSNALTIFQDSDD